MSRGHYQPYNLKLWIVIGIAVWLVMAFAPVYASGTDVIQSNDMNNQTAGNIGGHDSVGIGIGGSSVTPAIGDCLFTEFDSYFIFWDKQRGKENKHCLAMQEHLIGNHTTEARIKCGDTSIRGELTFDACMEEQKEHTLKKMPENFKDEPEVKENDQIQIVPAEYFAQEEEHEQAIASLMAFKSAYESSQIAAARKEAERNVAKQEIAERFNVEN